MFDITRHPQTGVNADIARLLCVTHLRHGVRYVHDTLPPFTVRGGALRQLAVFFPAARIIYMFKCDPMCVREF
jgi:hypothetical protein